MTIMHKHMNAERDVDAVPAPRTREELVGVQYLRGIASMMVVIYHLEPQLRRMGYEGAWLPGLSGGVDLFFVISGLIMWVTTCGRSVRPSLFWWRRLTRIAPLYWIVTTVMVGTMLIAPRALQSSRFDMYHVIASYLFVPAHHPVKLVMEPVVMPGWTLNYEMFFYLIFGISLIIPVIWRLGCVVLTLLGLVILGEILSPPEPGIISFYTSSIILEFALGIFLGVILANGEWLMRLPVAAGWCLVMAGFPLIMAMGSWPFNLPRVIEAGVPAAAVTLGVMVVEKQGRIPRIAFLRHIGDASYSIYLTQLITMSAASQVWRKLNLDHHPGGWMCFCLVALVASAAGGWLTFQFLERPLIALFRARTRHGVSVGATS